LTGKTVRGRMGHFFQEIETRQGAWPNDGAGNVQSKVAATRAEREKEHCRRRDALTRPSEFPTSRGRGVGPRLAPLPVRAESEPKFRAAPHLSSPSRSRRHERSDARWRDLARPTIFSPTRQVADFTARTMFAGILEGGGIAAITNDAREP